MILFLRQLSKKSISSNTFLYLKSSFWNSLTFLTMRSPCLFRKTLVDTCLGKRRCTKNENIMATAFWNILNHNKIVTIPTSYCVWTSINPAQLLNIIITNQLVFANWWQQNHFNVDSANDEDTSMVYIPQIHDLFIFTNKLSLQLEASSNCDNFTVITILQ